MRANLPLVKQIGNGNCVATFQGEIEIKFLSENRKRFAAISRRRG
jgi:hypothetical protein